MHLPEPKGDDYELPPPGTHLAVCYRVIDLGTQRTMWQGEAKHARKLLISWELVDAASSADGLPFTVSKRYTFSSSRKSNLRRDLEAWRGAPFRDEELGRGGSFRLENLIGKGCFVNVQHNEREGITYANVQGLVALPRGTPVPPLVNEPLVLSLDPAEFDRQAFERLSAGLRETIAASPEYMELTAPGRAANGRRPSSPESPSGDRVRHPVDDEIPF
jgi:hypothetical protein